jgi:hypothetical protein
MLLVTIYLFCFAKKTYKIFIVYLSMKMEESPISIDIGNICVIVASHISKPHRIEYLKKCIESLVSQSFSVSIYLSISFENEAIAQQFRETPIHVHQRFFLYIRPEKTPQMKHIQLVLPELIKNGETWVMFCDDDDRYHPNRTQRFAECFANGMHTVANLRKNYVFSGVYESTFGKTHLEQRHEFWCYGIHIDILTKFYERIEPYDDVIRHKCSDIVFGDYLRRCADIHVFYQLQELLYDYRVYDNADSITGQIQRNPLRYREDVTPPTIMDLHFSDYVVEWNKYLYDNLDYYIHDTFLRTVVGNSFETILKNEFKNHYPLLEYVDDCHTNRLKQQFDYLRRVCDMVYDIKITE